MFLKSTLLSDVDVKLSQVNVLLSEINVIISKCPDQVQSKKLQLLPRVDQILSELTFVVSFAQDDCSSDDDENDDIRSLEWDDKFNHYDDYYDLYIGDEEVLELRDELEIEVPNEDIAGDSSSTSEDRKLESMASSTSMRMFKNQDRMKQCKALNEYICGIKL